MHLTSEAQIRRLSQTEPVVYMIFDLLWLDGHSLLELPYADRRTLLAKLELDRARPGRRPRYHVGNGAGLLAASRRRKGWKGIVAKRLDCPYVPGRRSNGWVKVKNVKTAEVVVGGWMPGDGGRAGRLGALVVGFYEDGELRYAGTRRLRLHRRRAQARAEPARAARAREPARSRPVRSRRSRHGSSSPSWSRASSTAT